MACVGGIFAGTGRAAVRYRWAVLGAWAALTVLAMLLLPSLSSVTQGDNSSFLPASAPSEQAEALAAPLQGAASLTAVTVVVGSPSGLSAADEAAAGVVARRLARVAHVVSVRDAGVSADGKAAQFTVLASLTQNVGAAPGQQAVLCGSLRAVLRFSGWPAGMVAHLAGPVATRVDNNAATGSSGAKVQWVSIIFVIALLVAVFRSVLAPFVAVVPAVLVVLVASRLTAVVALHGGLAVSQIASLL